VWILVFLVLSNNNLTTNSVEFTEQMNCLQAIEKILEWEKNKKQSLIVKATCIKK